MERDSQALPDRFTDADELDEFLAHPSDALIHDLATVDGDIIVLGAGGKMGPTLARLARNAAPDKRILAVARFTEPAIRKQLENCGIETTACDLLDRLAVQRLPRFANVVFMAGRKFGATADQPLTWAINTYLPAIVAETFRSSRLVVFSTGNVYPLTEIRQQGPTEDTPLNPVGEYAQSCLARERIFEHFSNVHGTAGRLFRLNYAIEMRYGVLCDIASRVMADEPLDVTMGYVNVIWQGDANAQALRCLKHCISPITPLNVSGPETLSIRWLAQEFGRRLGRAPVITGNEAPTALLTNSTQATRLFGYPRIPLGVMLDWVADWTARTMPIFGKPTKFEVRDGIF